MTKWRIGCSGFYYSSWKNIFYPEDLPKSKWFEFYCQHFNTLELNVTFYRFPKIEFLKNWYDKSPSSFCFSAKVPRLITHYKRFSDTISLTNNFYNIIHKGLKEKAGCILFQLPSGLEYTEETLQNILNNMESAFKNAIEFRHRSWWNKEVFKTLAEKKICFCSISYPNLPDDLVQNTSVVYYRFHGVPELYKSKYPLRSLKKISEGIKKSSKAKEVFVYFNNSIAEAAIENAKQLQLIVSK